MPNFQISRWTDILNFIHYSFRVIRSNSITFKFLIKILFSYLFCKYMKYVPLDKFLKLTLFTECCLHQLF